MTMSAEDIVARKMVGNEGDISLESQCGQIHLSYRFSMVWYGLGDTKCGAEDERPQRSGFLSLIFCHLVTYPVI